MPFPAVSVPQEFSVKGVPSQWATAACLPLSAAGLQEEGSLPACALPVSCITLDSLWGRQRCQGALVCCPILHQGCSVTSGTGHNPLKMRIMPCTLRHRALDVCSTAGLPAAACHACLGNPQRHSPQACWHVYKVMLCHDLSELVPQCKFAFRPWHQAYSCSQASLRPPQAHDENKFALHMPPVSGFRP